MKLKKIKRMVVAGTAISDDTFPLPGVASAVIP